MSGVGVNQQFMHCKPCRRTVLADEVSGQVVPCPECGMAMVPLDACFEPDTPLHHAAAFYITLSVMFCVAFLPAILRALLLVGGTGVGAALAACVHSGAIPSERVPGWLLSALERMIHDRRETLLLAISGLMMVCSFVVTWPTILLFVVAAIILAWPYLTMAWERGSRGTAGAAKSNGGQPAARRMPSLVRRILSWGKALPSIGKRVVGIGFGATGSLASFGPHVGPALSAGALLLLGTASLVFGTRVHSVRTTLPELLSAKMSLEPESWIVDVVAAAFAAVGLVMLALTLRSLYRLARRVFVGGGGFSARRLSGSRVAFGTGIVLFAFICFWNAGAHDTVASAVALFVSAEAVPKFLSYGIWVLALVGCVLAVATVTPPAVEGIVTNDFRKRFGFTKTLGEGAFGEVRLARDRSLGRNVAIKILKPEVAANEEAVQHFITEARAIGAIDHPNVLAVHDFCEMDDHLCIVMQFAAGGSLQDKIKRRGPLSVESAIDTTLQLLDVLDAAHERGIIHLDLKPANLLFTERGVLKLADFGIAHVPREAGGLKDQQVSAGFRGTLPYMSPEQVRADRHDARTDLYAVGVILYEMLTGPFEFARGRYYLDIGPVRDRQMLADGILTARVQPPNCLRSGIPQSLERAVLHALNKRRSDRFHSAREFADTLRQV